MRPKKLILGAALLVVLAAAGGALVYDRTRPETIKQASVRYEQTAEGVKVYIHNPNKTWALRNQRLVIILVGEQRNIIRSYGPDENSQPADEPGLGPTFNCCLIDALPPGREALFRLSSVRQRVAGVTIDPDPKPQWVRWD